MYEFLDKFIDNIKSFLIILNERKMFVYLAGLGLSVGNHPKNGTPIKTVFQAFLITKKIITCGLVSSAENTHEKQF